ncbi:MAG: von Willebrand factor type A domain-containing protein [Cystobacter sp.]
MPSSKPCTPRWGSTLLALSLLSGCTASSENKQLARAAPLEQPPREKELLLDTPSEMAAQPEVEESVEMAHSDAADFDERAAVKPRAPARHEAKKDGRTQVITGSLGGSLGGMTAPPPPPPPPAPATRYASPLAAKSMASGGNVSAGAPMTPAEPVSPGNTFTETAPHAFTQTAEDRFSTFAVDVDTASYTVARRYLTHGSLPPPPAVRVEEFVNYFKYRYAPPEQGAFRVHLEGAPSPFSAGHHFVRVGIQGKSVSRSERKPAHLVFLVDTSGSMSQPDKLPLAKEAMKIAVKNLNENDTVALVTYAGSTRDVLPPTAATDLERIYKAIDTLESGGGTAMGSGMELAYKHAVKKASGKVVSRVVVLTDGDANIGPSVSADSMLGSIEGYVKEGVTLSAIGFGMGNYRDDLMEKLADKGNGNCFYIDSHKEARKVFEQQLTGTLEVIAKDVKVQVEFDPQVVRRYRLVGYENRNIADKDFREDKVDAGEIGAGHSVTALYEVELTQPQAALGTVRIRAKTPTGTEATEQAFPFEPKMMRPTLDAASADFRFALAVAATADVLRDSPSAKGWNLATVQKLADGALEGQSDRAEFARLLTQARGLRSASARDAR